MGKDLIKKIKFPEPGRYIVAVSGGVDSMSLLDLLARQSELDLIVAHFDHGIREVSHLDMELVHEAASGYGLEFVGGVAELGESVSEGRAREARYDFLESLRREYGAKAIITAHHLDDRVETMLLNQQRGAGWRGLAPLRETDTIKRPLLKIWKSELIAYANEQNINWREDSTNQETDTPRNYIRSELVHNDRRKQDLYEQLQQNDNYRDQREAELWPLIDKVSTKESNTVIIDRSKLLAVDSDSARDVLFCLLQSNFPVEISRDKLLRLEHFVKTARPGKHMPLSKHLDAVAEAEKVTLTTLG